MREQFDLSSQVINWYDQHKRDLVFRRFPSAYKVWVSEVMLQQTTIVTMEPYFVRFMEKFPTLDSLALASEDAVLKVWQGLGYYSRARNLLWTARMLVDEYGGVFPSSVKELLKFPGIGFYTASAIASLFFFQRVPLVDGNVVRVMSRFWVIARKKKEIEKELPEMLEPYLPSSKKIASFNQGLMEIGATVCLPQSPKCCSCPLKIACQAYAKGTPTHFPVKEPKKLVSIDVVVGIMEKEGRYFFQRRPESGLLAKMWEFPGGKREEGESLEDALRRELKEECNVEVVSEKFWKKFLHFYVQYRVSLYVYFVKVKSYPVLLDDRKWLHLDEIKDYVIPGGTVKILNSLIENSEVWV